MPGKLLGGVLIITGVYLTGRANGASGTAVYTAGENIAYVQDNFLKLFKLAGLMCYLVIRKSIYMLFLFSAAK
ncbi:hypothetical protein IT084_04695 [Desulfallas sp. Bu1-1]|jgi:hypothetical protein|uniref:hypothetical protein n=1 Tax=Desulfallas sp. Bu1-1 TaxID=2787620 RepID=UPI00189F4928|nr:hypothetical protein [Desulfallas sp. Bu1-1]MBF7082274.1 hypothetical protein [Desulfallas sp. Bu1-1]